MDREQAARQIAAHERAAASATDPAKRYQHLESARHYRFTYGIDPPTQHPPADEIFAEWTRLGLDSVIQDFWLFHAGQDHPGIGAVNHAKAFERVRAAARIAAATHKRDAVWIPKVQPGGEIMDFVKVTAATPKGEAPQFNQSRYPK